MAFAVFAIATWAFAAWLFVSLSPNASAGATPPEQYRHIEMHLVVPYDGEWRNLTISMFVLDDGTSDFGDVAAEVRAQTLADFPGAVEVEPGDVSAAYNTLPSSWADGEMEWSYNPAAKPDGLANDHQVMQASAEAWNRAGADFAFTGGGTTSATPGACYYGAGGGDALDDQNTIGWAPLGGNVLARACTYWGLDDETDEVDMEFSTTKCWTTGSPIGIDLQSVATHEFGHAAGLDHSFDSSAVMYASYSSGSNKRQLRPDDLAGIVGIYGADGSASAATEITASSAADCSPSTPTPTNTPNPTNTPSATNTPNATNTPSPTSTAPPVDTPTPTATSTPTVTPSPTATPTPTPEAPSFDLQPGANLVAWPGQSFDPALATEQYGAVVRAIYGWDAANQRWLRHFPGLPVYVNTLGQLEPGAAYWFIASGSATITLP